MKHTLEEIEKMLADNEAYFLFERKDGIQCLSPTIRQIISDLVEEVKSKNSHIQAMQETIGGWEKELKEENKRLREALEFYSNKSNYDSPSPLDEDGYSSECSEIYIDNGELARKALEGNK